MLLNPRRFLTQNLIDYPIVYRSIPPESRQVMSNNTTGANASTSYMIVGPQESIIERGERHALSVQSCNDFLVSLCEVKDNSDTWFQDMTGVVAFTTIQSTAKDFRTICAKEQRDMSRLVVSLHSVRLFLEVAIVREYC